MSLLFTHCLLLNYIRLVEEVWLGVLLALRYQGKLGNSPYLCWQLTVAQLAFFDLTLLSMSYSRYSCFSKLEAPNYLSYLCEHTDVEISSQSRI